MADAPRERESWMPAWETEEAAACQRMELPGWKEDTRWRVCRAVIQTYEKGEAIVRHRMHDFGEEKGCLRECRIGWVLTSGIEAATSQLNSTGLWISILVLTAMNSA